MQFIFSALDIILHLEKYLDHWATTYKAWLYAILFIVIFMETGLVVTPFLPGDSLLFAVGAIAARGILSLPIILIALSVAAILGDALNYSIGRFFGEFIQSRIVKPAHIQKTHEFYRKYGTKTIVLARFIPIVRTIAPFVAGIGQMQYRYFIIYNFLGGIFWITSMTITGYVFGNMEIVRKNLNLVMVGIIVISLLPIFFARLKTKRNADS